MPRNSIFLPAFAALTFLLTSCSRHYYTSPEFDANTKDHKIVAILPFETVMTGKQPENLKPEDIRKIEESESVAFQQSYLSQIYLTHTTKKHPVSVAIQPFQKTNQLLQEKGISIRDSWSKSPQELAQILGVDAVIRSKIVKTRYMSDLASMGINVGSSVLSNLSGLPLYYWARTNSADLTNVIFNGKDGNTLYTGHLNWSIDYRQSNAEMIDCINERMARDFPYVRK